MDTLKKALPEIPVETRTDEVLRDDFRLLADWFASSRSGTFKRFTENEIIKLSQDVVGELFRRGSVRFQPDRMAPLSRELFIETMEELVAGGLPFKGEHGRLVADGKKDLIIRPGSADTGGPLYVLQDKNIQGVVTLGKETKIDLAEFARLQDRHKITEEDRMRFWPGKKVLFSYPFTRQVSFEMPVPAAFPRGEDVAVDRVRIKKIRDDLRPSEMIKAFHGLLLKDPKTLSDTEILRVDRGLHTLWEEKQRGSSVVIGGKSQSNEDLINLHALLIKDIKRRGLEHPLKDQFDEQTRPFLKDLESESTPDPETDATVKAHGIPLLGDGTCPPSYPLKRGDRCFKKELGGETLAAGEGSHTSPHEQDGGHDHPGLPAASGGHNHENGESADPSKTPFGLHRHRPEDPLEGAHQNTAGSSVHGHPIAQGREKFIQWVVDEHFPVHKWIPNHKQTWIRHKGQADFRLTTRKDWENHAEFSMHSAGANLEAELDMFIRPETRLIELTYELNDGKKIPASEEIFRAEVAFLKEREAMAIKQNPGVMRATVLEKKETDPAGSFIYTFGLLPQGMKMDSRFTKSQGARMFHVVGDTLPTELNLDPEDVLELEFEAMQKTTILEDRSIRITATAARVLGLSSKKTMSIGEAMKSARENCILEEIEIIQDPETILKRDLLSNQIDQFMALPADVRSSIPDRFHFWKEKDTMKAKTMRDELVEAIKKKEVVIAGSK